MFDSTRELIEKVALGESTFLELKEVRFSGRRIVGPSRKNLADELAAFANSRGGVLILGADDRTREFIGIAEDRLDDVVDYVKESCGDLLEPPLENVVVDRLRLPDSSGKRVAVIKVEIPKSLFIHRSRGGYYHRVADSKRRMSTEYLARMLQQRSQTRLIRFDEQAVSGARIENLNPDLWKRFQVGGSEEDSTTFLRKLGIVATDGSGNPKPTVAGVLMACDDPTEWLPNAYIQAVAYRGNTISDSTNSELYQLDAMDIGGPLDKQIVFACEFVFKNMVMSASKTEGRTDHPQYDLTSVFEAIVNAVAHRDYSVHGSKTRLRLFNDRLELFSPGALVNSLSIDSLRYRQAARNEALCSLLAKCSVPDKSWLTTRRRYIMEKRGEGVPIILDNSTRLSGKPPEYQLIDDAELRLTIHAAKPI